MKFLTFCGIFLFTGLAWIPANETPQPQPVLSAGVLNSWSFEWQGIVERTYFTQYSTDLERWDYFDDIEYDIGLKLSSFTADPPKYFLRLRFSDIPTNNPETADFDLDGLGNRAELELGTDPLEADSDKDGVEDGAEVLATTDPLSDTDGDPLRAIDNDGDGVSDALEILYRTSPTLWDSDGDGIGDGTDSFPLNPDSHTPPQPASGDISKPTITLETPANATFVSGP